MVMLMIKKNVTIVVTLTNNDDSYFLLGYIVPDILRSIVTHCVFNHHSNTMRYKHHHDGQTEAHRDGSASKC